MKIADACGIKPERVGKLARGEGAITTYGKIVTIADGLRIPGRLLGLAPRAWESNEAHSEAILGTASMSALGVGRMGPEYAEGEAMRRREFLAATISAAGSAADLPVPDRGRVGLADVQRLKERTIRLRRLDDFLGGEHTYPIYARELSSTSALLSRGSYLESTAQALLGLIAEQAQQAGWAAFDAGRHAEAEQLYRVALRAATDAHDQPLIGNSLAFLAYQQISTAQSGVETATASCERAGSDAPPAVRALLFERLAWAHAKAAEPKGAEQALAEAEAAVSSAEGDQTGPDWATWVDRREVSIMAGRCWAELGRPLRAVPVLEQALAGFPDARARDKSLYTSWLAHAYLDAGEVEQAAAVTERCFQLALGVGSVRPHERVTTLLNRLKPYGSMPKVAELMEYAAV
ncbi:XRE family transcriptional regulator [Streptomyces millisiae]|uniref:XRE family transcriptional regulator n=1 Tax=Streptomyces millisiae TaxID=3075542 RepID=A0ABU2LZG0_9ACTN|nr:XRE family transcriptional regulator [Streptomyces sp. DSM 44918]MDT0322973.1 XRE family transcriptional regulator [Streptomyces sp. DSM 44918]